MWVIVTGRKMGVCMWEYDVLAGFFNIDHAVDALQAMMNSGGCWGLSAHPIGLAFEDSVGDLHFM